MTDETRTDESSHEAAATSPARKGMEAGRRAVRAGNTTHLVVAKEGHVALDVPLTVVIIGMVLAPWVAAAGVVLAVVTGHHLRVARPEDAEPGADPLIPAEGDAVHETSGSAVEQIADEGAPDRTS